MAHQRISSLPSLRRPPFCPRSSLECRPARRPSALETRRAFGVSLDGKQARTFPGRTMATTTALGGDNGLPLCGDFHDITCSPSFVSQTTSTEPSLALSRAASNSRAAFASIMEQKDSAPFTPTLSSKRPKACLSASGIFASDSRTASRSPSAVCRASLSLVGHHVLDGCIFGSNAGKVFSCGSSVKRS